MTNIHIHFFHKLIDTYLAIVGSNIVHIQAHGTDTTETVKYLAVVDDYGYSHNWGSDTSTASGSGGSVAAPATCGSVSRTYTPVSGLVGGPSHL